MDKVRQTDVKVKVIIYLSEKSQLPFETQLTIFFQKEESSSISFQKSSFLAYISPPFTTLLYGTFIMRASYKNQES